jgi:hypothetical protein
VDRRVDRRELLARRQQEGADGGLPPDVLVADQGLEAVPALAEEHRILAAGLAPGDEVLARIGRRIEIPAVGLDARRLRGGRCETGGSQRRAAGDESASLQDILLGADPILKEGKPGHPHIELIREMWRICQCARDTGSLNDI